MTSDEPHALLDDGTRLSLRPLRVEDRDEFIAAFERLSATSRYTRFMSPMDHLTRAEVDYFVDIDHRDHEAIVAVEEPGGHFAGLGRYIRDPERPDAAEIAITIEDEWQGRGVGSVILARLAQIARERGIRVFTAEILGSNLAMRALFDHLDDATHTPVGDGAIHAEATL